MKVDDLTSTINTVDNFVFVNPTGRGVRMDGGGDGRHGAPRGKRKHDGLDFACIPGQAVLMPVDGQIVRVSLPYKYDTNWRGVHIYHKRIELKMWYFKPDLGFIGRVCDAGEIIGYAQDISQRYENVTPHIHLRIVKIDPLLLFRV